MKTCDYHAPTSLGEAVALLAEKGERARPLGGGTDLLARLRRGLIEAEMLVDTTGIPEANVLQFDPTAGLTIGAAVPWSRVVEHPQVAAFYPCLRLVAQLVYSRPGKRQATLGGNLCAVAAESDSLPALYALEATCRIVGPQGQRTAPLEKLWVAPGRTSLGRGEMLVSVTMPVPRPHSGAWYIPCYPGSDMDLIFVRAAASLTLDDEHCVILAARVALGAAEPTPLFLDTVSAVLVGQPLSKAVLNTAEALARVAAGSNAQAHDAPQRAEVAGLLTRRALAGALAQVRREPPGGRRVLTE